MGEYMTIEEVNARFPDEWVLLGDPRTNEFHEVIGGTLLIHSKDRDTFDEQVKTIKEKHLAFHYTGEVIPKGAIVIL